VTTDLLLKCISSSALIVPCVTALSNAALYYHKNKALLGALCYIGMKKKFDVTPAPHHKLNGKTGLPLSFCFGIVLFCFSAGCALFVVFEMFSGYFGFSD